MHYVQRLFTSHRQRYSAVYPHHHLPIELFHILNGLDTKVPGFPEHFRYHCLHFFAPVFDEMQRFIVTGGAGFIGSHMVAYLLDQYPHGLVYCLDRLNYSTGYLLRNLTDVIELPRFIFLRIDLAQRSLDLCTNSSGFEANGTEIKKSLFRGDEAETLGDDGETLGDEAETLENDGENLGDDGKNVVTTVDGSLPLQNGFCDRKEPKTEQVQRLQTEETFSSGEETSSTIEVTSSGEKSPSSLDELLLTFNPYDNITILHFAAESSVDRSFLDPSFFIHNNILSMLLVLEACRLFLLKNPSSTENLSLIHISTDEVYGEQQKSHSVAEDAILNPTNPYSATKAACDLILNSYIKSFGLNVSIVRANNIYGPRQYPEKLISKTMDSLKYLDQDFVLPDEHKVHIHGDGSNKRSYLHVTDFVKAVDIIWRHTVFTKDYGHIYNVGVLEEISNRDLVMYICSMFVREKTGKTEFKELDFLLFSKNRCYNDMRYSINTEKISALGWKPLMSLKMGIMELLKEI